LHSCMHACRRILHVHNESGKNIGIYLVLIKLLQFLQQTKIGMNYRNIS
jgi:hypothetical protein